MSALIFARLPCRVYSPQPVGGFIILFDPKTISGRRFEGVCGLFALISVVVIFFESGAGTQYHLTYDEWHIFVWIELIITGLYCRISAAGRLLAQPGEICFQFLGIYRFSHRPAALRHVVVAGD